MATSAVNVSRNTTKDSPAIRGDSCGMKKITYEVPKWWEGFEEFLGNAVLNFYLTFLEDRDYVKVKQNYYFCIERNFRFW